MNVYDEGAGATSAPSATLNQQGITMAAVRTRMFRNCIDTSRGLVVSVRRSHCHKRLWVVFVVALVPALLALSVLGGCTSDVQDRSELRDSLEGPALAVFQLAEAAEAGDLTGVRTHMDTRTVGLTFARATMAQLDSGAESSTPPASGHSGNFNPTVMEQTFAERFDEAFKTGVADGTVVAEGTLFSAVLIEGPSGVEMVNDSEAVVRVTLPAAGESEERTVDLRLSMAGQRWILVAIENTTDLYGLFF